jgi:hypothetical protein
VINGFVREFQRFQPAVAAVLVGRDQTNFVGYNLAYKAAEGDCVGILDCLRDEIALASYRADNGDLAGIRSAATVVLGSHVRVPILLLPADIGFIDFDTPLMGNISPCIAARQR